MHFAGIATGTIVFGVLADKFGRKLIFVVAILLMAAAGTVQTFSPDLYTFYFFEYLKSVGTSGVYPLAFVLGVEMVGKSKREIASITLNYFYCLGEASVGLIAWLSGDWQIISAALAAPPLLFVVYYWFLPESARWLIAKGDQKGAKDIIRIAATTNCRTVHNLDSIQLGVESKTENTPNIVETAKEVLKSKTMMVRMVILLYNWTANAFVYYGLSLSSVNLSGNKYLNFILVALIGIPGYAIAMKTMNTIGRRSSMVGAMIICGVTCIAGAFIDQTSSWLSVSLYLLGKMGITASFGLLYCYSTEVLPTVSILFNILTSRLHIFFF